MKRIAFIFPGQGSQNIGMGKKLCSEHKIADRTFDEANEALGFDLKNLCHNGEIEELTKTQNTQPALLTHGVAMYRVMMEELAIKPNLAAGHSLGEITALTCSGAINFEDAVKIVNRRGVFMQDSVALGGGSMAAISGVDKDLIEEKCGEFSKNGDVVVISNYNSPEQIVISGNSIAVANASEELSVKGARVIPLKVSAPFHSPLMSKAADRFKEELELYKYSDLGFDVVSNVTAKPYNNSNEISEMLVKQITDPVRWIESMEYFNKNEIEVAVELGPKNVLKNLMRKNISQLKVYAFDREKDKKDFKEIWS